MIDDATEAIRPVALDPVHHEAAVGGAERADALPVEPRILRERGRESLLQIDEGLAAPVAADGVGERLAVTGRAVKVDHHHRITAAGEGLRIPAVGPQVPEAHLRTAVHHERDRISPAGLEPVGLHHVAVHALIVPALEAELREVAHATAGEQLVVHFGESPGRAATQPEHVQVLRPAEVRAREHHALACRAERLHRAAGNESGRRPALRVDAVQGRLAQLIDARQQGLAVRRCAKAVDGPIPAAGEGAHRAAACVLQHDVKAVRLEPRALLREPGEVPVGEEHRQGIPGGVAGGEIHRRRAAVHRRLEQIEVGRPGLRVPGDARREHQRAAVGAEGEVLIAAEGLAGNVRIEALRHVDRGRARCAARTQRRAEQMRTRAVAPGVPVADEQALVEPTGRLVPGPGVEPLAGAGEGRAVGKHLHRQRQQIRVRGYLERAHLERIVGDALGIAPGERQAPHLRAPRARRQEVERAAVGRPARARVVRLDVREAPRCRRAGREFQQPQAGAALVGVHVRLALHEGDLAAVGGELRIGDALEKHQVFHRKARVAGLGRACGAAGRDECADEQPGCDVAGRARPLPRCRAPRRHQPTSSAAIVHGSCLAACSHSCSAPSSSTLAMYQRALSEMRAP